MTTFLINMMHLFANEFRDMFVTLPAQRVLSVDHRVQSMNKKRKESIPDKKKIIYCTV